MTTPLRDRSDSPFWTGVGSGMVVAIIQLAIDFWVRQPRLEVIERSAEVAIARPGGYADILLLYAGVGVLVWVWRLVRRKMTGLRLRFRWVFVLVVAGVLAGNAVGWWTLVPKLPAATVITGRVENERRHVYLFVRPLRDGRCWLQRPVPLQVGPTGVWRAEAFLSGQPGDPFELIAVASTAPLHPEPFAGPDPYACDLIPAGVDRAVRHVQR